MGTSTNSTPASQARWVASTAASAEGSPRRKAHDAVSGEELVRTQHARRSLPRRYMCIVSASQCTQTSDSVAFKALNRSRMRSIRALSWYSRMNGR